MATVLLTGAAGLLGRRLVAPLSKRWNVIAVDSQSLPWAGYPEAGPAASLSFDLRDYAAIYDTFARHAVDIVVHAGAISHPGPSFTQPVTSVQVNFNSTVTLLEAARLFGVKRFIFISSIGVYGAFASRRVDEDHPTFGHSPYGVAKIAAELMGGMYAKQYGLPFVALRYGHIYGPDRLLDCPIKMLVDAAAERRPLRLASGADKRLHVIYQEDAATPVLRSLEREPPSSAYNVADGRSYRLQDVADLLRARAPGWDVALGPGPLPREITGLPPEEGEDAVLDVTRASRDLDFRAGFDLEAGVNDYFDRVLAQHARGAK